MNKQQIKELAYKFYEKGRNNMLLTEIEDDFEKEWRTYTKY